MIFTLRVAQPAGDVSPAQRVIVSIILVPAKELPAGAFPDGPFWAARGLRTAIRWLSLATRGRVRAEHATRVTPA